jgi:FMN-dependent NADH-azoreductase
MAHHLFITASVRNEGSQSTHMGQYFCDALKAADPTATFTHRNVGITPPPHPTHDYTVANYTPPDERTTEMKIALKISDELIDELLVADKLVVAVPMYNFSVPSTFKAYIDNIVRVGRTFQPTEGGGFQGALGGKKAIFITARGAMYGDESPIKAFDLQTPWLTTVFGFMGLTETTFVNADGLDFGGAAYRQESLDSAKARLMELSTTW